ncbi:MAG: uracil-DNA glycosylase [Phycisphaerae bacterium]|nr:uracil-DNA glycosylase [Phycisphaerae bacterium]
MDLNRVLRQHLEMDAFFTGFALSGPVRPAAPRPDRLRQATSPTLEAVADRIRDCRRCPLGSSRTHAVPGEGHPRARILFVGEAPGADEDAQARPFVGKAGQLLGRIIEACGLRRADVYITNVLKCRPPGNRQPCAEEIVACLPFLQAQIECIRPEAIVALGAHAARTLLNTNQSITQLRGPIHEVRIGPDAPPVRLLATYHPAYLLRNYTPENRRLVWEDMKRLLAELNLPIPAQHGEARE